MASSSIAGPTERPSGSPISPRILAITASLHTTRRCGRFLGAPIVARGEVFGDIYLTEKLGAAQFSEEDEQSILVLASQAGVAIHNARLYEESRRRERWLDAVRDITNAVLSGTGSDQALALIASRARDLVAADLATVVIPDPDGNELVIQVADGDQAEALTGRGFPAEGSISGAVVVSGQTRGLRGRLDGRPG